ncbi:MAG TPA: hypothetical protein VF746_26320 [Longimicrobium sp.]
MPNHPKLCRVSVCMLLATIAGCGPASEIVDPVEDGLDAFPRWEVNRIPAAGGHTIFDLWFRDDGAEGWAVGDRGLILHYVEGNWHRDAPTGGPAADWRSIAFDAEATQGIVVGSGGQILQYRAASHSWTRYPESPTSSDLYSVWLDRFGHEGYAVGRAGVVLGLTGEHWRMITPSRPATVDLLDVASDGRDIWVRDTTTTVTSFRIDRGELVWKGIIPRFEATDLWSQFDRLWVAGLQYPPPRNGERRPPPVEHRFSVRAIAGEPPLYLTGVPMPGRAGWVAPNGRRALIAGRDIDAATNKLIFRWAYVTQSGAYVNDMPDTAILAMWVNREGTEGWVAGGHGLIARLRWRPLEVRAIRARAGSLERLNGKYRIELDLGEAVPQPRLVSVQLVHDDSRFPLDSTDYTATTNDGAIHLSLTEEGTRKASLYKGRSVRFRFTLAYSISSPSYLVSYQTQRFTVEEGDWWARLPTWARWGIGLLLYLLATVIATVLATRVIWLRRLIFSVTGRELLGHQFGKILFPLSDLLVLHWTWLRMRLLDDYVAKLPDELEVDGLAPEWSGAPELRAEKCGWLADAVLKRPRQEAWKLVFEEMSRTSNRRVLWIQAPSEGSGEILERWTLQALAQHQIPFLARVDAPRAITDQIRAAWDAIGDIPREAPAMYKVGRFVFFLDLTRGEVNEPELREFVQMVTPKSLVVIYGRPEPFVWDTKLCHLKIMVSPAAEREAASAAEEVLQPGR